MAVNEVLSAFAVFFAAFALSLVDAASPAASPVSNEPKEWCYAIPPANTPSFSQEIFWGYCKGLDTNVPFTVDVTTSSEKYADTTAPVLITFFGDEGESEEIQLNRGPLMLGAQQSFQLTGRDVGDLNSIRIRMTGQDSWKCTSISVWAGYKRWDFDCTAWLSCPQKCEAVLPSAGNQRYFVSIKTAADDWAGSSASVSVIFVGRDGESGQKLLKTGFFPGQTDKAVIQAMDVGPIKALKLVTDSEDAWKCESISVARGDGDAIEFKCPTNEYLKCPQKCEMMLAGTATPFVGGVGAGRFSSDAIDVDCATTPMANKDFGLTDTNFRTVRVRCPAHCQLDTEVKSYGASIHPEDSTICKTAVNDGVLPDSGGELVVTIVGGLAHYDGLQADPFKSVEFDRAARSFYMYSALNLDGIEKDMRIVDNEGKLANAGRLEARVNGRWGSVCSAGVNPQAGDVACRYMGYRTGKIVNTACQNYNGKNFCAWGGSAVAMSNFQCNGAENNPLQCSYSADSSGCNHNMDLIVECSNVDPNKPPAEGTVRVVGPEGNIADDGKGRLEVYRNGVWGSVCNDKFTDLSARVACTQMGYTGGKLPGAVNRNLCATYKGKNYCGSKNLPIQLNQVDCTGKEDKLVKCSLQVSNFICRHDEDIVIECEGGAGDPSGKAGSGSKGSAMEASVQPPLPKYLPYRPAISIKCDETGESKTFKGAPVGTSFIVECPAGCAFTPFPLWGTFAYTTDSSICRGAIHSGAMSNQGGQVMLQIGYGQSQYFATNLNGIMSTPFAKYSRSFMISKPTPDIVSRTANPRDPAVLGAIQAVAGAISGVFGRNVAAAAAASGSGKFSGTSVFGSLPGSGPQTMSTNLGSNPGALIASNLGTSGGSPGQSGGMGGTQPGAGNNAVGSALSGASAMIRGQANNNKGMFSGMFSSFLEMTATAKLNGAPGSDRPVFKWVAPPTFQGFDGQSVYIDTSNLQGGSKVKELSSFTVQARFRLKGGENQYRDLVVHSGCGGWVLFLNKAGELCFARRCDTEAFSGFKPVKDEWTHVSVSWDHQNKIVKFFINGEEKQSIQKSSWTFQTPGKMVIGRSADTSSEFFNGDIGVVTVFDGARTPEQCKKDADDSWKPIPKGNGQHRRYTQNGLQCQTPCSTDPIPGRPGAPTAPKRSASQFEKQAAMQSKMTNAKNAGEDDGTFTNLDDPFANIDDDDNSNNNGKGPAANTAPAKQALCSESASDEKYAGETGRKIRVQCPMDCSKDQTSVYGTDVYTDDSSICKSAIHAGLTTDTGGEVMMVIENGMNNYKGTLQNGVQSLSRDSYSRSIKFEAAPPVRMISCSETMSDKSGDNGARMLLTCGPGCASNAQAAVYGTEIFTADSSICRAAIAFGAMTDAGGEIEVIIAAGQLKYKGGSFNNIATQDRGQHIRSFTFDPAAARMNCISFREEYTPPDITQHWDVVDPIGAINGPSDWSFGPHPTKGHGRSIVQAAKIYAPQQVGTLLVLRGRDCGDAIFHANVFMIDNFIGGLVFRYMDQGNYYILEWNMDGLPFWRIRKFRDGIGKELAKKDIGYVKNLWYRIRIEYLKDNIQVYVNKDGYRRSDMLFNITDPERDLSRGSVGLSSYNMAQIYFDGVRVDPYPLVNTEACRIKDAMAEDHLGEVGWDDCLTNASPEKRLKYCKSLYGHNRGLVEQCNTMERFCDVCCQKFVPASDKILGYTCWRQCRRATIDAEQGAKDKQNAADADKNKNKPRLLVPGEFVDYLQKATWQPAKVERIVPLTKGSMTGPFMVSVVFESNGVKMAEDAMYPSDSIQPCGTKVKRPDCVNSPSLSGNSNSTPAPTSDPFSGFRAQSTNQQSGSKSKSGNILDEAFGGLKSKLGFQ